MKTLTTLFTALLLSVCTNFVLAEGFPIEGQWRTIDDDTGEPKSIVRVWVENDELKGKILELLNPSEPNPKCTECKGIRKDKPITGMTFFWGLHRDGDQWVDGRILDPQNGKEYSAKMEVIDDGAKLKVRGYLGFSLLGRTQIWERVD